MSRRSRVMREAVRLARLLRLIMHVGNGALLAYPGFAALALTRHDPDHAKRRAIVRWWMRRLLRILNVRVCVAGEPPAVSALYVVNHISWLDIPVLRSLLDASFVAKQEVRDWPIVGGLAARVGTIFLARGERQTLTHAADHMTWMLHQGRAVAIFPEGTTTDGSRVLRFHARLYQAAIRTHAPVLAIALHYPGDAVDPAPGPRQGETPAAHAASATTHPAAPFVGDMGLARHLWRLLGERGLTARVHFCAPVIADRDRRALAHATRTQIVAALGLDTVAIDAARQRDFIAR